LNTLNVSGLDLTDRLIVEVAKLKNLQNLKKLVINDCSKLTLMSLKHISESRIIDLESLELSKGLIHLPDSNGRLIKEKINFIKGLFISDQIDFSRNNLNKNLISINLEHTKINDNNVKEMINSLLFKNL
jgi:hypothetical protein